MASGRPPVPNVRFQNPVTGVPRVRSYEVGLEAPVAAGELLVDRRASGLPIEGNRAVATIIRHRADPQIYSLLCKFFARKSPLCFNHLYSSFEITNGEETSEEIEK